MSNEIETVNTSSVSETFYRGVDHPYCLSDYQKDIVDWVLDDKGNAIVNAVAGSGKTSTLKAVARYLLKGLKRFEVAFFAFNKPIADEIAEKMADLQTEMGGVSCMTLHSHGFSCLRYTFKKVQLNKRKYSDFFSYWYNSEKTPEYKHLEIYEEEVLKLFDLLRYNLCEPKIDVLQKVSDNYNVNLVNPETQRVDLNWLALSKLIDAAMTWGLKFEENEMCDFTDMIWGPVVRKLHPLKFKNVLVDESQDLNRCQRAFVGMCVQWGGRMLFVGDEKQAIYGFAGASTDSMSQIQRYFKAREFPLSICYRCPKSHVQMAKEIVNQIEHNDSNIDGIIETVGQDSAISQIKPGDLVICRTNAPLVPLAFALIGKGIGARIRGKDIGSALAGVVENIGKPRKFEWENFEFWTDQYFQKKIDRILKKNGGKEKDPAIDSKRDEWEAILKIKELTNPESLGQFQQQILDLFEDKNNNIVWLSSVHRAKGLEADNVFVLGLERMPRKYVRKAWELEQEWNLKYIALTRAKKAMYFIPLPERSKGE